MVTLASPPSNVTAQLVGGKVQLSWVANGADGHGIIKNGSKVAWPGNPETTSWVDQNTTAGNPVTYGVTSYDKNGEGAATTVQIPVSVASGTGLTYALPQVAQVAVGGLALNTGTSGTLSAAFQNGTVSGSTLLAAVSIEQPGSATFTVGSLPGTWTQISGAVVSSANVPYLAVFINSSPTVGTKGVNFPVSVSGGTQLECGFQIMEIPGILSASPVDGAVTPVFSSTPAKTVTLSGIVPSLPNEFIVAFLSTQNLSGTPSTTAQTPQNFQSLVTTPGSLGQSLWSFYEVGLNSAPSVALNWQNSDAYSAILIQLKPATVSATAAASGAATQGQLNNVWSGIKSRLVSNTGIVSRSVTDGQNAGGQPAVDVISEGVGSILLFAVQYNDQTTFDLVEAWAYNNLDRRNTLAQTAFVNPVPSSGGTGLNLMGWHYNLSNSDGNGAATFYDADWRTDADVDRCLALLWASNLWGGGPQGGYLTRALAIAADLKSFAFRQDPATGYQYLTSNSGQSSVALFEVDPSYGNPSCFKLLKQQTGDVFWDQATSGVYDSILRSQLWNAPPSLSLTSDSRGSGTETQSVFGSTTPSSGDTGHGVDAQSVVQHAAGINLIQHGKILPSSTSGTVAPATINVPFGVAATIGNTIEICLALYGTTGATTISVTNATGWTKVSECNSVANEPYISVWRVVAGSALTSVNFLIGGTSPFYYGGVYSEWSGIVTGPDSVNYPLQDKNPVPATGITFNGVAVPNQLVTLYLTTQATSIGGAGQDEAVNATMAGAVWTLLDEVAQGDGLNNGYQPVYAWYQIGTATAPTATITWKDSVGASVTNGYAAIMNSYIP